MPQYICPKLEKGEVGFEIDWENQRIALREDYPDQGSSGAWFSDEWVSFDVINERLRTGLSNSSSFSDCFDKHTVNNSPMLCAVLLCLGCIDRGYQTFSFLSPLLQQEYERKKTPV